MASESEDQRQQSKIIRAVLGVGFLWGFVVVCWGLTKWQRNGSPNFEMTGQFGDSFGFIGAVMAATAAYFAYRTYKAQSEETALLRGERREAAKLRAEPSFLGLLERRYDVLKQFAFSRSSIAPTEYGQTAMDLFADRVEADVARGSDILGSYETRVEFAKNHHHLFRFTYHIVRYAERHFDEGRGANAPVTRDSLSYHYVRLLRSQLSDSELFALALNVLTPDGEGAKPLYERFALFHNLSPGRKQLVRAAGDWDEKAFGLPENAD